MNRMLKKTTTENVMQNGLKAITIHQPWASLIAMGIKRIENRTWATKHRGPIAIHAGKSKKLYGLCQVKGDFYPLESLEIPYSKARPLSMEPFGAIIAVGVIADCFHIRDRVNTDPWATGPYCWVLESMVQLESPIPYSGQQLLWELNSDVAQTLLKILKKNAA